jgi:hypothetical protein
MSDKKISVILFFLKASTLTSDSYGETVKTLCHKLQVVSALAFI